MLDFHHVEEILLSFGWPHLVRRGHPKDNRISIDHRKTSHWNINWNSLQSGILCQVTSKQPWVHIGYNLSLINHYFIFLLEVEDRAECYVGVEQLWHSSMAWRAWCGTWEALCPAHRRYSRGTTWHFTSDNDRFNSDFCLHSSAKKPDSRTKLCECNCKTVKRYTIQKKTETSTAVKITAGLSIKLSIDMVKKVNGAMSQRGIGVDAHLPFFARWARSWIMTVASV